MSVSGVEFVNKYTEWLEEIDQLIAPDAYPAIRKLYKTDPRDLVGPEALFMSDDHAIGFIWRLLAKTHKQMKAEKSDAAER